MQLEVKEIAALEQPRVECLRKPPVARDVPITSIKVIYDKNFNAYRMRFFPDPKRAGSLFYALNSEGVSINSDINLVAGNKVIAHVGIFGPVKGPYFELGGFDKNEANNLLKALVHSAPP